MDFNELNTVSASDKGAFCQLWNPKDGTDLVTEKGDPIGFTVLGKDSRAFKQKEREIANGRIEKGRKGQVPTAALIEQQTCQLLAHVATPKNIVVDGEALKADPKVVADFLARFPWAREQVDEFIADRANFFKAA